MSDLIDPLLVVVLLLNFLLLGTSRLRAVIRATALQGVALGAITLLIHGQLTWTAVMIALGAVVLKALVIPSMLVRATRDASITREVEPLVGFTPSLVLVGVGTGMAILFSNSLPLAPQHAGSLLVPAALATVFTGFLLLTTRRKAITQVVGYLILENGVFIMGMTLVEAIPFLVEIGVLLDLFVGIFVMGIIVNHISREFSSMDTRSLTSLKE